MWFRGRGPVGNKPLHFLLLLNGELAAVLFRPSLLSPEGFLASFLEAFLLPVKPGPTDLQFIGYNLLCTTFLQHVDRPTAYLFLNLWIQGPCISFLVLRCFPLKSWHRESGRGRRWV